jgi:hypothetical protein
VIGRGEAVYTSITCTVYTELCIHITHRYTVHHIHALLLTGCVAVVGWCCCYTASSNAVNGCVGSCQHAHCTVAHCRMRSAAASLQHRCACSKQHNCKKRKRKKAQQIFFCSMQRLFNGFASGVDLEDSVCASSEHLLLWSIRAFCSCSIPGLQQLPARRRKNTFDLLDLVLANHGQHGRSEGSPSSTG